MPTRENSNANNLLDKVSKYLGKTPDEIKSAAKTGNIGSILSNVSKEDSEQIQRVIADKNLTNKLLSTDEARKLVKDVFGGK